MAVDDPLRTLRAYDALAPAYDLLTETYAHEDWLRALERLARAHGLRGRRVLDVACGTGKSFAPLLARGYEVTACDGSPAMAAVAARRAAGRAAVHVADMRALPVLGAFDLVLCLDDVINHLLEPEEVVRALAGMGRNLAPGGLLVFDVNTELAYRGGHDVVREDAGALVAARGRDVRLAGAGATVDVVVDVFRARPGGDWARTRASWRHRHYPLAEVTDLVDRAGLAVRAVCGQRRGGVIEARLDEAAHPKAVVVAGPPSDPDEAEGGPMYFEP